VRSLKIVSVLFIVMALTLPAAAQKFAYVNSQEILMNYKDYVDVQNRLEEIRSGYDAEYQQLVKEYQDLIEEIESQSLLLSPEKKKEKERQAQEKYLAIEKFKYEKLGPEGEFYQKQREFSKPILDKVNNLITKIGEEEGYDFIFDAATGAILHSIPEYDITQKIIDELNKKSTSSGTTGTTTN